MERIRQSFLEFVRDERGATVIEYGLVAVIISITIITSVTFYGARVNSFLMAAASGIKMP
ncbi:MULTISPECIES: Flp family type IVb pilin [Bosea]|jgi:Flp pilus assembly pilin Flp|uniref:Flp family type IVb pilin n=1 Tax=Bosea TaxID=85413 RepID=UPI0021500683|nr:MULTISPECIES: Flp family type IVb pilin [Bosea]MCR4521285.1 Flp family type IVb pilin [Bosea sp. 47.2.35]MDR6826709.1 pilus assembly protein Flp/PilA [Bosea robiniae]MDR6893419.1 pilus assembly protein Flp/PilA [Bosea sp. BE109]MDR7136882.1 pilus assembly protein Flp/PilA [Bosea sp. BE168]MDR7173581.1 pilus assembly protein Flp/PilA [Bosea sp. BE271]